ncbi:MAG: hypothetical protein Q9182_001238 [Xanthomendoza sp. 2 TL-2023]
MSTKVDHSDWTTSFFNQEEMGRRYKNAEVITGPFAREMIQKAGLLNPNLDNLTILDNACGTGVVAAALHDLMDDATKKRMKLTCGDFAEPMLKACKRRIEESAWPHTEGRKVDAQKTGLPDESFSHVLTNFAIMGLKDPTAAIKGIEKFQSQHSKCVRAEVLGIECLRILRPDGICAFTTWSHVDWVGIVRAAFATLPDPPPFPTDEEMYRSWGVGDWWNPDWILNHLQDQGTYDFEDVQIEVLHKDLKMESPATFVDTFSVMIPMILSKFWSEEVRKERGKEAVDCLLAYMNQKYGEGREVEMHWVANLVTARKPAEGK